MKKIIVLFAILFSVVGQVEVSPSVDLVSKYFFRGWKLTDKPVVQPSVDLNLESVPLTFNVWGSWAIADRDVTKAADEIDYTVSYGLDLEAVEISIGYILYTILDNSDENTSEVFASVDLSVLPISVGLYYDFDLTEDFYASASYSAGLVVVDFDISVGYHNSLSAAHADFGVSKELELGSFHVKPFLHYGISAEKISKDHDLVFGVSIAF